MFSGSTINGYWGYLPVLRYLYPATPCCFFCWFDYSSNDRRNKQLTQKQPFEPTILPPFHAAFYPFTLLESDTQIWWRKSTMNGSSFFFEWIMGQFSTSIARLKEPYFTRRIGDPRNTASCCPRLAHSFDSCSPLPPSPEKASEVLKEIIHTQKDHMDFGLCV